MSEEPIIATKEMVGEYDAIETAKPGEPLFGIQGGDPLGPKTVLFWAEQARNLGRATDDPKQAQRLLRKASDAEMVAWAMQDYQRGVAASMEGERARYNDAPLIVDEEDQARRSQRRALREMATRLNNIVAIGTEAFEALAEMQQHPEQEVALREAVAAIKEAALVIEPRRNNERS